MPSLQVQFSEPDYAAIVHVAEAHGQSVEAFVAQAAQRYAEDEAPIRLTPEQIEICLRAEAQIDAGEFYTAEQIRERFVRLRDEGVEGVMP